MTNHARGPAMTTPTTLIAGSGEELGDILTWLDEHPDDLDLKEAGIDPAVRGRLDTWLQGVAKDAGETYPRRIEVPAEYAAMLQMVIDDWCEVLSSHDEDFGTRLDPVPATPGP